MKSKIDFFSKLIFSPTARNTYAVFLGNIISAFFSFLFTVILVRGLSLSDFGYFSALLSLMMLVVELSDTGIGQSLSSFIPPLGNRLQKLNNFLKASFFAQVIIALAITVFIIGASSQLSLILFHTSALAFLINLTAVSIFCSVLANFVNYSLSARRKFLKVSLLTSFGALLRLLFLLAIAMTNKVTLENSVVAQTLSIVFLLLVSLYFIKINFLSSQTDFSDIKKLMRFAYLLGFARMFTGIAYRLDVLMLVSLKNAHEAGIYSTASRVISIYPLLSASFLTVIAPKIATINNKTDLKKYLSKALFGIIALVSSIIFMLFFAGPFMLILFGDKALAAVTVFRLLLISMIFFVLSVPVVSLAVYYLKAPYILTVNSIIQLLIVVFGNIIFIPQFGRNGPAVSLILAFSITLITTTIWTVKLLRKRN